jgi:hypothetical protein
MNVNFLILGGCLSAVAALLHLGIIAGGAEWYRFFGAGEAMATMAEQGSLRPVIITLCIAFVLALWACYAFSGAGLIPRLPLLKLALVIITSIYLIRGLAGFVAGLFSDHPVAMQNSTGFWLWSSIVCLLFGLAHLKGVIDHWVQLS